MQLSKNSSLTKGGFSYKEELKMGQDWLDLTKHNVSTIRFLNNMFNNNYPTIFNYDKNELDDWFHIPYNTFHNESYVKRYFYDLFFRFYKLFGSEYYISTKKHANKYSVGKSPIARCYNGEERLDDKQAIYDNRENITIEFNNRTDRHALKKIQNKKKPYEITREFLQYFRSVVIEDIYINPMSNAKVEKISHAEQASNLVQLYDALTKEDNEDLKVRMKNTETFMKFYTIDNALNECNIDNLFDELHKSGKIKRNYYMSTFGRKESDVQKLVSIWDGKDYWNGKKNEQQPISFYDKSNLLEKKNENELFSEQLRQIKENFLNKLNIDKVCDENLTSIVNKINNQSNNTIFVQNQNNNNNANGNNRNSLTNRVRRMQGGGKRRKTKRKSLKKRRKTKRKSFKKRKN